ncbi:hypothetical protein F8388_018608 [Cannabis sativa]|uniref:Pentatricopeptide repeat-containing protein n=1 Tax=Cannabis sativa TaxID=3483 RepID=A0A7J6FCU2_CANSA|nr:hypothetical protein F8388_018608 [Cannabis sativa]
MKFPCSGSSVPQQLCHLLSSSLHHHNHYLRTLLHLKQTHTLLLKFSTTHSHHHPLSYHLLLPRLLSQLLLLQSPPAATADTLRYALNLFDEIPNCRNEFIWSSLIRYNVVLDKFKESFVLYAQMQRKGVSPSGFTFSSVLNACARFPAILEGREINAKVVQTGFLGNKVVQTALLDMYAKCGFVREARDVFDRMVDRDVIAWTAMICGYTKKCMMEEARLLFCNMGRRNVVSWTTMVAGYANCGDMEAAKELYDEMEEKNLITWVAMVAGYGKCGNVMEARRVFDEIPKHDASSWAAMVACYAQNGYAKEAIDMYKEMRKQNVIINEVAMVGAISACTQLVDTDTAATLVNHVDQGCCCRSLYVSNALIHLHSKCGNLDEAVKEFNRMNEKDVVSYTALITALGDHGKAKRALQLFSKMQKDDITPNQVTFIGVLNACSFAGLVEDGCRYFELMTRVYRIKPLNEHYACIIDLLGRAGLLGKAYTFIKRNGNASDAKIWSSLLASCKVHGDEELAKIAAIHLFEIEPENTETYVLLASIYAAMNKWDDAERHENLTVIFPCSISNVEQGITVMKQQLLEMGNCRVLCLLKLLNSYWEMKLEKALVKIVKVEEKPSKDWGGESAYRYLLADGEGFLATKNCYSNKEWDKSGHEKELEISIRAKYNAWVTREKETYMILQ